MSILQSAYLEKKFGGTFRKHEKADCSDACQVGGEVWHFFVPCGETDRNTDIIMKWRDVA
jgi:hypothetical protein